MFTRADHGAVADEVRGCAAVALGIGAHLPHGPRRGTTPALTILV